MSEWTPSPGVFDTILEGSVILRLNHCVSFGEKTFEFSANIDHTKTVLHNRKPTILKVTTAEKIATAVGPISTSQQFQPRYPQMSGFQNCVSN